MLEGAVSDQPAAGNLAARLLPDMRQLVAKQRLPGKEPILNLPGANAISLPIAAACAPCSPTSGLS